MMHEQRTWCVTPAVSVEELADTLTQYTWTCCTGFALGGYLFLSDATGPAGAQEYAVVKAPTHPDGPYTQVESVTMSWCTPEQALGYIRHALNGGYDDGGTVLGGLRLETRATHRPCHHCM